RSTSQCRRRLEFAHGLRRAALTDSPLDEQFVLPPTLFVISCDRATSPRGQHRSRDFSPGKASAALHAGERQGTPDSQSPPEAPATTARTLIVQDQKSASSETSARVTVWPVRDCIITRFTSPATWSTGAAASTTKVLGSDRSTCRYASRCRCDSAGDTSVFLCCKISGGTSSRTWRSGRGAKGTTNPANHRLDLGK